MEEKDGTCL